MLAQDEHLPKVEEFARAAVAFDRVFVGALCVKELDWDAAWRQLKLVARYLHRVPVFEQGAAALLPMIFLICGLRRETVSPRSLVLHECQVASCAILSALNHNFIGAATCMARCGLCWTRDNRGGRW